MRTGMAESCAMGERLLKKERISDLCMAACKDWEVYLPLEHMGGDVQFVRLEADEGSESLNRLKLDYDRLVVPPKAVAFPQLESLFRFDRDEITESVAATGRKVLFGVRACDLRGIRFLDQFFREGFDDPYYCARSASTLVIVVVCTRPNPYCFCTSAGTGPSLPAPYAVVQGSDAGFDVQMTDIGDAYVVEAGSAQGQDFVGLYNAFEGSVPPEAIEHARRAKQEAAEAVRLRIEFDRAIQRFCEDRVPQRLYERIAERCIYCGGCAYVCPTCNCFGVFDEKKGDWGRRCRVWDGCMFEGYTRQAGGHNPRFEKWTRTARRYEHKLKYDYLETGRSGCVGCGRCLASCPVNIGMSQVIEEVASL